MSTGRVAAIAAGAVAAVVVLGGLGVGVDRGAPSGSCPVHRARTGPVLVAVVDSGLSASAGLDVVVDPRSASLVPDVELGDDPSGHGTAMASIVHDGAPTARLLVLGALDGRARAEPATVARAVGRAVDAGAELVELSVTGIASDDGVRSAVVAAAERGVTVVLAAGNDGRDLDGHPGWERLAAVPGVVVVAAADGTGALASSTNWGSQVVDVAALGRDVPVTGPDGGPSTVSGSSAAAASVTGQLAELLAGGSPQGRCSPEEAASRRAVPSPASRSTRAGFLAPAPGGPPGSTPT